MPNRLSRAALGCSFLENDALRRDVFHTRHRSKCSAQCAHEPRGEPWPGRFGFSWFRPFRCEKPRFRLLDFLGIPWILSSEMRLINGLRGIFSGKFFASPHPRGSAGPGDRDHSEGRDRSWSKLSRISDNRQSFVALPLSSTQKLALLFLTQALHAIQTRLRSVIRTIHTISSATPRQCRELAGGEQRANPKIMGRLATAAPRRLGRSRGRG
jgi:hypothetical protein